MERNRIGFIGLGAMGLPMARNLLAKGFQVTVHNRTRARAEALAAEGARIAETPSEAARDAGIVVTMLTDDAALDAVTLGNHGLLSGLGEGGLHISMSTVSPDTSRRLATAHAERGCLFLAAPVFGRPDVAAAGKLWLCQSGSDEAKTHARPVLEALGQGIRDFGADPGAANVVKLSGNFLIMSAIEALSEMMAFGEKNGLDRTALAAFFGETIFSCPIYQNYGGILARRQYGPGGFKLSLGMKDMRLVRETAEKQNLAMPLADVVRARLLNSLSKGRSELDWMSMELAYAEENGLARTGTPEKGRVQ